MAQILMCLFVPGSCTVLTVDEGSASTPLSHCHKDEQEMAELNFAVLAVVSWLTHQLYTA